MFYARVYATIRARTRDKIAMIIKMIKENLGPLTLFSYVAE